MYTDTNYSEQYKNFINTIHISSNTRSNSCINTAIIIQNVANIHKIINVTEEFTAYNMCTFTRTYKLSQ